MLVGAQSFIFPFGSFAYPTTSGKVYYKIQSKNEETADLQRFISNTFAIENFESTQVVVITVDKLPEYQSFNSSIVSNLT